MEIDRTTVVNMRECAEWWTDDDGIQTLIDNCDPKTFEKKHWRRKLRDQADVRRGDLMDVADAVEAALDAGDHDQAAHEAVQWPDWAGPWY